MACYSDVIVMRHPVKGAVQVSIISSEQLFQSEKNNKQQQQQHFPIKTLSERIRVPFEKYK